MAKHTGAHKAGAVEANAHLIAAAPELLDALKRCEELLSGISDIRWDLAEFQDAYIRQARAAIAKADAAFLKATS
jgi:hypothetical protein